MAGSISRRVRRSAGRALANEQLVSTAGWEVTNASSSNFVEKECTFQRSRAQTRISHGGKNCECR